MSQSFYIVPQCLSHPCTHLQYVEAAEDVLVLEEAHHLEFPEDPLRADEALEHVGQLLERDPLPVARVGHGPDDAEGAVPDRPIGLELGVGVACGNDEMSIHVSSTNPGI